LSWTAYPEIDQVLAALLSESRALLGDDLFGMYLFGSLTSGGFDEETSDIDFVVVTRSDPMARQTELGALNRRIQASGSPWAAKLEGSFLPLRVFEDFNPAGTMFPTIGMGGWYGLDHTRASSARCSASCCASMALPWWVPSRGASSRRSIRKT